VETMVKLQSGVRHKQLSAQKRIFNSRVTQVVP
jgi:hypothetical protein